MRYDIMLSMFFLLFFLSFFLFLKQDFDVVDISGECFYCMHLLKPASLTHITSVFKYLKYMQ